MWPILRKERKIVYYKYIIFNRSHHCPWKAIAHLLQVFSTHTHFVAGNGSKIRFWEDLWWEDQPLCLQFPSLFRVTTTKNYPISIILGNNTSLSWDLTFHYNLIDTKIEDLERLRSLLSNVHLTPSISNARTWVPSSSRVFSVKSFFSALYFSLDSIHFYQANFLWKSRVPSKIRVFAWLVALKKVNTRHATVMDWKFGIYRRYFVEILDIGCPRYDIHPRLSIPGNIVKKLVKHR